VGQGEQGRVRHDDGVRDSDITGSDEVADGLSGQLRDFGPRHQTETPHAEDFDTQPVEILDEQLGNVRGVGGRQRHRPCTDRATRGSECDRGAGGRDPGQAG
jgi:hypothetical protein